MIGVIGATGMTGQLISKRLNELQVSFCLLGRSEEKLRRLADGLGNSTLSVRRLDVLSTNTFGTLEGLSTIINCAGPFTDLGEPIVAEAVARKIHYLDTTGEQGFIARVYEQYGKQAQQAAVVLVPACAFEYAIGDAAAAMLLQNLQDAQDLEIAYSFEGAHTSAGTKQSVVRASTAPGFLKRNGELEERPPAAVMRKVDIETNSSKNGFSFPGGEVFMVPLYSSVQSITTLMVVDLPAPVVQISGALIQLGLRAGLAQLFVKSIRTSAKEPTKQQRQSTRFRVIATARSGQQSARLVVTGLDPYWLTAVIAAGVAQQIEQSPPKSSGALAPSMVAGARLIQSLSESAGAEWKLDP